MIENKRWIRVIQKESCMEIINMALSYHNIHVVAIGPESCLRTLYFRAMNENQNSRLHFIDITAQEIAMASHLSDVENILNRIIDNDDQMKGILLYISCGDLILGTCYHKIITGIGDDRGISIKLFVRGPLTRRKIKPKERLQKILYEMQSEIKTNND